MALSARSGTCVCVVRGPKPFCKVLRWKDNWSVLPEGLAVMKLFLCFCSIPSCVFFGHFRRTVVLFCASSNQSLSVLQHQKVPLICYFLRTGVRVVLIFHDSIFTSVFFFFLFLPSPPLLLCGLFGIMSKSHFEMLTCSVLIGVVSPSQFHSTRPHQ